MYQGQTITDNDVTWKVKNINDSKQVVETSSISRILEYTDRLPVGCILPFIDNINLPRGFLLCNGASVLKDDYRELYAIIGNTYGEGDETHFVLPDLRNLFLEGSNTAGEIKPSKLPNIKGSFTTTAQYKAYMATEEGSDGAFSWTLNPDKYVALNYADISGTDPDLDTLSFDASKSNSIYDDDATTVHPPSLTCRFIIKALDISTFELSQKRIAISYKDTFTYIYPNDGTEENPANITKNSRYVETNPFPGYAVQCQVEYLINNEWGTIEFSQWCENNGVYYSAGAAVNQHNDDNIIIITGTHRLILRAEFIKTISGSTWETFPTENLDSAPCRIKVWKVGKLNSDVPDLQEIAINSFTISDEDRYLANSFTIIYPNGGTADNPASVDTSTNYIENNPFPGYYVNCVVEILYNNVWYVPGWWTHGSGANMAYGIKANQNNDNDIMVSVGNGTTIQPVYLSGGTLTTSSSISVQLPCRVKVWKVGKISY